jgi:hypothetical protein
MKPDIILEPKIYLPPESVLERHFVSNFDPDTLSHYELVL